MNSNVKKISIKDASFPTLLKEIPAAPQTLYLCGKLPDPRLPHIAIVGTRRATPEGKILAKRLAKELAGRGAVIVSGLALGIDAAAHEGTLAAEGKTIAVLANGLDTIYPRSNENLARQILEKGGTIVSEYPPGTPSLPHQFLERNRIISGLSVATIIVEAPIHSGALVTARHALDQGREVLVAAGPALHQNYRGSHLLIRHGARLVTSADDVMEDLQEMISNFKFSISNDKENKLNKITDEKDLIILNTLRATEEPLAIDKIIELTKLETHVVNQHLTFLLFEGLITEKNGKFIAKI